MVDPSDMRNHNFSFRRHGLLLTALLLWLPASILGMAQLVRHSQTPGSSGDPVPRLIAAQELDPEPTRPTLVMFVHPRCPCSVASLRELQRLQESHAGQFASRIVFSEPVDAGQDWRQTRLRLLADALPDTRVVTDPGGLLSAQAGAGVSGTVALYEADGGLRYWGGITSARGHEGPSLGSAALDNYLRHQTAATRAPVYGCPLVLPGDGVIQTQPDCDSGCEMDHD